MLAHVAYVERCFLCLCVNHQIVFGYKMVCFGYCLNVGTLLGQLLSQHINDRFNLTDKQLVRHVVLRYDLIEVWHLSHQQDSFCFLVSVRIRGCLFFYKCRPSGGDIFWFSI